MKLFMTYKKSTKNKDVYQETDPTTGVVVDARAAVIPSLYIAKNKIKPPKSGGIWITIESTEG